MPKWSHYADAVATLNEQDRQRQVEHIPPSYLRTNRSPILSITWIFEGCHGIIGRRECVMEIEKAGARADNPYPALWDNGTNSVHRGWGSLSHVTNPLGERLVGKLSIIILEDDQQRQVQHHQGRFFLNAIPAVLRRILTILQVSWSL